MIPHINGFYRILMHICRRRKKTLFFRLPIGLCFVVCLFPGCNKKSQNEVPLQEPSWQVTLSFDVYNHTQGYLTGFERIVENGGKVVLKIRDLDIKGVDKDRIVIRKDMIGPLTAFDTTGAADFEAPPEDRKYTIYLMNASHGADYRVVDTWAGANEGILEYGLPIKWFREDRNGYRGPDDVIQEAVDLMNEALTFDWATYGNLAEVGQRMKGSFGVGYGYCRNQFGWHNPYWAGINPDHCTTYEERLATFIEELFELVTRLNDIGGRDTANLITDPDNGELNGKGRDLLAYVFIKDRKI